MSDHNTILTGSGKGLSAEAETAQSPFQGVVAEGISRPLQLGQEEAFDYFFRLYFPMLVLYAREILQEKFDAEDLVQGCFLKLWEKDTEVRDANKVKSFLTIAVRNACITQLRKKRVIRLFGDDPINCIDPSTQELETAEIKAELIALICQQIESLPARIRQVCELFYLEGRTEREISQLLKIMPVTVKSHRQRGLTILRQRLKNS